MKKALVLSTLVMHDARTREPELPAQDRPARRRQYVPYGWFWTYSLLHL